MNSNTNVISLELTLNRGNLKPDVAQALLHLIHANVFSPKETIHLTKLDRNSSTNVTVNVWRQLLVGTPYRLDIYGRNPNRKQLGLRRNIGRVALKNASYLSIFLVKR